MATHLNNPILGQVNQGFDVPSYFLANGHYSRATLREALHDSATYIIRLLEHWQGRIVRSQGHGGRIIYRAADPRDQDTFAAVRKWQDFKDTRHDQMGSVLLSYLAVMILIESCIEDLKKIKNWERERVRRVGRVMTP